MFSRVSKYYLAGLPVRTVFVAATFAALCMMLMLSVVPALSQCLTGSDVQQIVRKINSGALIVPNKKLRQELLEMKRGVLDRWQAKDQQAQQLRRLTNGRVDIDSRITTIGKTVEQKQETNEKRLCEILKTYGFPGRSLVGDDGVAAAFYLFKQFTPIDAQIEMIPAIAAAANKNELPKNDDYAAFIDRLRLHVGVKQLFGTQAFVKGDFLVLAPIEKEQQVDARRSLYNMAPLADYVKYLERLYRMPLMRERIVAAKIQTLSKNVAGALSDALQVKAPDNADKDEVIRVESELVSLNVRVSSKTPTDRTPVLEAADFKVFEDGREEQISFFAKTDTPFDLVVLLDLSGSTTGKQGIVRNATKRFIALARPADRVGIVTFTDRIQVVADLTSDHEYLRKSVDKIDNFGRSYVWDGLLFALRNAFGDKPAGRRRAVVMMSTGWIMLYSQGLTARLTVSRNFWKRCETTTL